MCAVTWDYTDGREIQVTPISQTTVRIQIGRPDERRDTGLNRYGFILPPDPAADTEIDAAAPDRLATGALAIQWDGEAGTLTVSNAEGDAVLEMTDTEFMQQGVVARFRAAGAEDWVGFGDQTREHIYHRGTVADCHVRNVKSYVPVPFFMSTRGVGVLVNTTHRIVFDMCHGDPDHFEWRDGRGTVDFYVMVGNSFRNLLDEYTKLTGRPKLPPEYAFGLWYICRTQANDYEAVNDAVNFRREGIPCDVIGLEPGWMEKNYDGSIYKSWSKERFPIPSYAQTGPHNFFNSLYRMGYKLELWLCCDYDLSFEAERRVGAETEKSRAKESTGFFQHDAELDEHFSHPKYLDTITKRDEAWYEHLKKFVDQGVSFFKQDGAYQVLDHPDRRWGNGMQDDEMHNLYPLLYARQMLEGYEEHTGKRGLTFTPCGWVGFQAWAGTWTGDTGGGEMTLGAILNTAIVGHSWATNDMEVTQKAALHFGYLLPWAQINSWNYFRMPWAQGEELLEAHRFYSRFRARLIPYIYSYAWQATQTGYPLIVPLTLEYPDDPECREIRDQFLLGRDLMVCAFNDSAYFPKGKWRDVWTGEVCHGGVRRNISWPENRGGGLYVREGAIIPHGPLMQYRGEKPNDAIDLYVFPGPSRSEFVLYDDDGVSLEHRDGAFATTSISVENHNNSVRIVVGEPEGRYAEALPSRVWTLRIAADSPPAMVEINGAEIDNWHFIEERHEVAIPASAGPVTACITW